MAEKQEFEKLQKVLIAYQAKSRDYFQYEQSSINGEGLNCFEIPFDVDTWERDKFHMRLFLTDMQSEDFEDDNLFSYLATREKELDENYEKRIKDSLALRNLDKGYFLSKEKSEFPQMTYEDITEHDLFGYPVITAADLQSEEKGIWGDCGYRKIRINLKGWEWPVASDVTVKASLYWFAMGNKPLENIFENEIRYDKEEKFFTVYVDTNRLQRAIKENDAETNTPSFIGRFEIHQTSNTEKTKTVYGFPIKLVVKDTSLDEKGKSLFVKGNVVSIDFGTSATCAAVRTTADPELFTLSGEGKRNTKEGDNEYENPTNLMIYNWSEVFKQWEHSNKNCPFLVTKSETVTEMQADYDSGYTVEDEYKSVDEQNGHRKMQAIIMQLKMIPYRVADGETPSFVSYDDECGTPVYLVDDSAKEDGVHFDPIAFYGYLLGRAINKPINDSKAGALYKRYQVTYPAKFNKDVRDKIKASLEYGIKRSLPASLQEAKTVTGKPMVTVSMDHSEPEACMGAVAGRQLKLDGKTAKLFAVYDLGGGTMDFSFGIYRVEDANEIEDQTPVLQFFGIDGDEKIGGEKLIHQLAYRIYRDSRDEVEKNGIKFVKPKGEPDIEGFTGLLSDAGDEIANTNLSILKEKLARPLFKYPSEISGDIQNVFAKNGPDNKDADDNISPVIIDDEDEIVSATEYKLNLRDRDNNSIPVTLQIKDVDTFLKEKIESTIIVFKKVMDDIFERNADEIAKWGIMPNDPVEIFLGGHASKQHYVEKLMKKIFEDSAILHRVGDGLNKEGLSLKYAVNEKTAVAFGQLRLEDQSFKVIHPVENNNRPAFMFNVGYRDREDNFVCVLGKNETDEGWKKANKVNANSQMANLLYTTSPDMKVAINPIEEDVSDLVEEGSKRLTLYVRLVDERTIALGLGTNAEPPEAGAQETRIRLTE